MLLAFGVVTVAAIGCDSGKNSAPVAKGEGEQGTEKDGEAPEKFVLGDMLEPFTPPPLEEIERTAEWTDRPVLSGAEELRKKQHADPTTVTIEQALTLKNEFPKDAANNEKILEALGRLAPVDGEGVDYDATWVRHVGGDLKSSNPIMISSVTEFEFQALTGFGYLGMNQELEYFGSKDSIVSWQTSKDRMIDKIVLREDLVWSDGKPITAEDIKFSFLVIMSKAVSPPAVRQGIDQLKWVEAYDPRTVVFFHKQPLATNTTNMSIPVIPKHVYEKSIVDDPTMALSADHARLEDQPVVGGAYELVRRVRNQEFVLRRRESYYMHEGKQVRAKPYFAEIRVKAIEDFETALLALKGGQIEEMELRAEQWASKTNDDSFYDRNTKVTALEWTSFHFDWNCSTPFFSDKRVRQAMSWAFDYQELLHTICRDLYQPNRGPYHPTSFAFPKDGPTPYHQDLDKAEDLLDAAGWTDSDGDGIRDKLVNGRRMPFEFTMLTYQTETGIQTATLMKESLRKIGVICNVKPTEFTVLTDAAQKHRFEATMGGWGAGSDPDSTSNIFVTNEGRNYGLYSNPEVDELFVAGRREFDREKRAAIYGKIHNILWEDQPYTWLFYRNSFFGFSKKLRGYNFCPTGPYNFDPGISGLFKPVAAR
jgi:peptide/nickel transport system substrate-binding protein